MFIPGMLICISGDADGVGDAEAAGICMPGMVSTFGGGDGDALGVGVGIGMLC
jgi:hypothetical protein